MIDYQILDEIADQFIPNELHKELHIIPKEVWTEAMIILIENGIVKNSYSDLMKCAKEWESLLYRRSQLLN